MIFRRLSLGLGLVAAFGGLLSVVMLAARPSRGAVKRRVNAKQSSSVPLRALEPAGTTKFSTMGLGAVETGVQCDANGNVYMNSAPTAELAIEDAREGIALPLTRLSLTSGNTRAFPYPILHEYAHQYGQGFYVSPRGDVYALVEVCRRQAGCTGDHFPGDVIVKYNDDGTVDSVIRLKPPDGVHILARKFAAFLDGNFLVTGFALGGPPHYLVSKPFTGIFDRGGGYVGPLVLPNDVTPPKHMPPPIPFKNGKPIGPVSSKGAGHSVHPKPGSRWFFDVQQGLMVGALDGTIYLLRATSPMRLYTISSTGTVLGERLVRPPKPGMRPLQASLTEQGMLFVQFQSLPTLSVPEPHSVFAQVDPQTGKVVEAYSVSPKAGIPACMDEENELLFLRSSKSGRLEVAKYVAQ